MRIELNDIINMQTDMLNALKDYQGVLKLPNCNGCAGGLDICPADGEPLRINCPAFYDKSKGERPQTQTDPNEPKPDFMNEPVVDSGVCEPASIEAPVETETPVETVESNATEKNVPNDPKLLNYLKH